MSTEPEHHDVARYFMLSERHTVQCTCGEKFVDRTERAAMRKHFHHGVRATRQSGTTYRRRPLGDEEGRS